MNKTDLEQHDIALFRKEVGHVEKLSQDKVLPTANTVKAATKLNLKRSHSTDSPNLSADYESATIGSEESLSFRRSGIQERLLTRLRNGQFKIEAELDLHGMTIPLAQQALLDFITDCQHYHIRSARIIHGKGWGSKDHKPVLKTKLNSWLRQLDDILAFCSARIEDGGTGAVYILLRRQKQIKN